jgi:hypothetical protein
MRIFDSPNPKTGAGKNIFCFENWSLDLSDIWAKTKSNLFVYRQIENLVVYQAEQNHIQSFFKLARKLKI